MNMLPSNIEEMIYSVPGIYVVDSVGEIPVCYTNENIENAIDCVFVKNQAGLDVLRDIGLYVNIASLLNSLDVSCASSIKDFVSKSLSDGIYIYGAYKVGLTVAREAEKAGIKIKGFVDRDLNKQGLLINGVKVFSPLEVCFKNETVVVASGRHGNEIYREISKNKNVTCLGMLEFLYAIDASRGIEDNYSNFIDRVATDSFKFVSAFLNMLDKKSRDVFDRLVGVRINMDLSVLSDVKSSCDDEYFDSQFVSPNDAKLFVDAGSFDGDTLERLENKFGMVCKAYLFEPEIQPYFYSIKKYQKRDDVFIFNFGLSDKSVKSIYNSGLSCDFFNEHSGLLNESKAYLHVIKLDMISIEKVGLIKMDIEGFECQALRGAEKIIKRDKPVLAVCAYHKFDDFWRIIDTIFNIRDDYSVGMRHYSDILDDTTIYFY